MTGGALMETIFLVCAAVGGTLLLCQFLMSLLGIGHHASSWFVGVLSFRALVTAITFFGLGGLSALEMSGDPSVSLGVAILCGGGALLLVAWMMRLLMRLKADGTQRIDRAVGNTGTVYLSVPANQEGTGKVTVKVQNRTVEYLAVTR